MTLPPFDELADSAYVVRLPMRVRFRGVLERELMLLRGPEGWGEFGPFLEYDDGESSRWLSAAIEAGWLGWPAPRRDRVPVNATVPAVGPREVAAVLDRFPGAVTAKIKVAEPGQELSDDVVRVRAVVDVIGAERARIRVDANGGWSVAEAVDALTEIVAAVGDATFEYAEQPCRDIEGLAAVRAELGRRGLPVLIAADESVRKAEDPLKVAVADAADVVIVKVAPLGGVRPALAVADQLGAHYRLPVVVSSALDSSVGIGAGLALAGALPELPFACGLATVGLFVGDVAAEPLLPVDGAIDVRRVGVDPERLLALTAPPDRQSWWRERLRRCYELLESAAVDR